MKNTKKLTFTNEQKSLIWQRFVEPTNGTQPEAMQFVEICETFGLNPLLGDIVFQAYGEGTRRRVSFITTRDALLRIASHQDGYAGPPNSGVVREGDIFKFLPSEGKVHHEFGQQRGNILGAYAVLNHRVHNPVAVFVDFEEYFNANSGVKNSKYGNQNVWDKLPSSMIVKVAEVFVLRRQFPLGGLHTTEEMSLESVSGGVDYGNNDNQQATQPKQEPQQNENLGKGNKEKSKPISLEETKKEKESKVKDNPASTQQTQQVQEQNNEQEIKQEQNNQQNGQNNQSPQPNNNNLKPYTLERLEVGKSPSGTEFARVFAVNSETGERVGVLTKDVKKVNPIRNLEQGGTFLMSTYMENSFMFLDQAEVSESKRSA